MNVVNKVTIKSMKQNRKRTIVTILGVIICVSMLTAISIIFSSFQDVMYRSEVAMNGNYQIQFQEMTKQDAENLIKDDKVNLYMRVANLGYADLSLEPFALNGNRQTLAINAIDTQNTDVRAINVSEGRLPQSADEIVIGASLMQLNRFDYTLNDQITLPIYQHSKEPTEEGEETKSIKVGEHTYTITGIIDDTNMLDFGDFNAFVNYDASNTQESVSVFFTLNSTDEFFDQYTILSEAYPHLYDNVHATVLSFLGIDVYGLLSTYIGVGSILIMIILIGSISLIYNAFSISLSERSRYLGMLSSVGATKRQKQNSVFFEAFIIGLISIPLGIAAGIAGMAITFIFLNPYMQAMFGVTNVALEVNINWMLILLVIVFAVLILLFSAWVPALRAAKIDAISAIRQSEDIKIRKRDVKTSRLTRKIFGIEAELGLKNMKRNRSRYLATISSLIVCIFLFMASQFFTVTMQDSVDMMNTSKDADIAITLYQDDNKAPLDATLIKQMSAISSADTVRVFSEQSVILLDVNMTDEVINYLLRYYELDQKEELERMYDSAIANTYLQILSDDDFAKYCVQAGISNTVLDTDDPSVILVNQRTIIDNTNGKREYKNMQMLNIQEQETLHFRTTSDYYGEVAYDEAEKNSYVFTIAKITDVVPEINTSNQSQPEIILVINEANMKLLNQRIEQAGKETIGRTYDIQLKGSDSVKLEDEAAKILDGYNDITYSIQNYSSQRLAVEQRNMFLSILLYGFLTLILLICIANILNSISTSVNLRKREFAMIKSIGITKRKFNRMICFETLFYGIKACIYGIPIGLVMTLLLYKAFGKSFGFAYVLPIKTILMVIVGIFVILSFTMSYAIHKIRKDNIVETIRCESI